MKPIPRDYFRSCYFVIGTAVNLATLSLVFFQVKGKQADTFSSGVRSIPVESPLSVDSVLDTAVPRIESSHADAVRVKKRWLGGQLNLFRTLDVEGAMAFFGITEQEFAQITSALVKLHQQITERELAYVPFHWRGERLEIPPIHSDSELNDFKNQVKSILGDDRASMISLAAEAFSLISDTKLTRVVELMPPSPYIIRVECRTSQGEQRQVYNRSWEDTFLETSFLDGKKPFGTRYASLYNKLLESWNRSLDVEASDGK